MRFLLIAVALLLLGCPAEEPTPSPTPTPTPTPEPPPIIDPLNFPLRVQGGRFVDALGAPVQLLGAIVCCGDKAANGWPLISEAALRELAAHGANWTHVRMGPHAANGPDSDAIPAAALAAIPAIATLALELGVALEVDVLDGWGMKHDVGFWGWTCATTSKRPTQEQLLWTRRVAEATRQFPNVMYQTSNEGFDCPHSTGTSKDWEFGIRDELRRSAPGHLIGTNSHGGQIEKGFDYAARHQDKAFLEHTGYPLYVNETGPSLTPEQWEREARMARGAGNAMHLWRGSMTDAQWADALRRLREIVS